MIKLAAIVGTNADFSYNRLLLRFMKKHFKQIADIDVIEIKDLPAFSVDVPLSDQSAVWAFKRRIQTADGVIFSTPEYDHSIPACLKSAIEWLSYHCTVLYHKPSMVVGVSYGVQASSRAQEHMRQILASPDCSAYVLPGHEVLIGKAKESFNQNGDLVDPKMVEDLEHKFDIFTDFVQSLGRPTPVAKSVMAGEPTINDAYVNFPTGRLSLKEIQQIFATMPFEVDFVDNQGRFAWFSAKPHREHDRSTKALGQPVEDCHPPKAVPAVRLIINNLKSGHRDHVDRPVVMKGHRVLIQYYAVRDADGRYLGTMEFTGSVEPILTMAQNDAWGAPDANTWASQSSTDATTGASKTPAIEQSPDRADQTADASTGASQSNDNEDQTESTDASISASKTDASTGASQTDASTGASQSDDEVDPARVKHDADRDGLPDMAPMKSAPKPEADASTGASQNKKDASTGSSQTDASTGASQK